METYEFGIMSNKWKLESDDKKTACVAMSIFIGKNIPIAIYSPEGSSFMPKDILEDNKNDIEPEKIKKCLETIKKVV